MRTPLSRRALAALTLIGALWAPAALADESTFELTIRDQSDGPADSCTCPQAAPGVSTAS